jgi:hypothetical protein
MKYKVVGAVPLYIDHKPVMPGDTVETKDLPNGINIGALVAGGHLEKMVVHRRTKKAVTDE